MSRKLYRLGRWCATHGRRTLALWFLLFVLIAAVGSAAGGQTADTFEIPGTESQAAFDLLDERFPAQSGSTARVVFHTEQGTIHDEPAASAIAAALDGFAELDTVTAVTDLYADEAAGNISDDATIAFAEVRYDAEPREVGVEGVADLEAAGQRAADAGVQVEYTGDVVRTNAEEEGPSSELVGLAVAVIVLLFAFGSVIAMGLPILTALTGLGIGLSLVTLLASVVDLNSAGPILATMIGLGVGIDYALFIVTRHREFLHEGMTVAESAGRANATAGSAVVFAGGTVVIAILGLMIAGLPMVTSMGIAAAVVVTVMVLVSVSLLPAVLGLVGHRIDRFSLPGMRARRSSQGDQQTLSYRWSHLVSRHPWRSMVGGFALLLLLAVPLLSIRIGTADDGNEAAGSTLRSSYDLLTEGFGPGFNGPFTIVVDLDGTGTGTLTAIGDALEADGGVARVTAPVTNPDGDTAVLTVFPASKPQDAATEELVHRLRSDVLADVVAETGGAAYVTGSTAAFVDLSDKISARLPWFIAAVIALSFLLLTAVFRSILVPLKAAVMNLLAIGSAYGVVVAIFQWGWLKGLFGVEETVPIISFLPMMMFAILFGLSMDYEVFILSRIREEYLKTGKSRESVVDGITATARVITSAAIIMISVFGAFMLGDNTLIKMFGFGMAFAVFIDATVVRMLLVPATMELLGDANWWFPAWLDRLLPNVDIEGEVGLPEPEYEVPVAAADLSGIDDDQAWPREPVGV